MSTPFPLNVVCALIFNAPLFVIAEPTAFLISEEDVRFNVVPSFITMFPSSALTEPETARVSSNVNLSYATPLPNLISSVLVPVPPKTNAPFFVIALLSFTVIAPLVQSTVADVLSTVKPTFSAKLKDFDNVALSVNSTLPPVILIAPLTNPPSISVVPTVCSYVPTYAELSPWNVTVELFVIIPSPFTPLPKTVSAPIVVVPVTVCSMSTPFPLNVVAPVMSTTPEFVIAANVLLTKEVSVPNFMVLSALFIIAPPEAVPCVPDIVALTILIVVPVSPLLSTTLVPPFMK